MKTLLALALIAAPATAATSDSYAELEKRVSAACAKASGFEKARVSRATIRFSDDLGVDTRLVSGIYPQPHMKRAEGLMLCAYDRRTRRAETQDAAAWWARAK